MHKIIWLIGSPGCGKEVISKLLMAAYNRFVRISTSAVLKGGRSDGLNVEDDSFVHDETVKHLHEIGFYDFEGEPRGYIFDGAGRNGKQVKLLMGEFRDCGQLSRDTHVMKLNVRPREALTRMVNRWKENSAKGTLRKEEIGLTEPEVKAVFRRRLRIWSQDRIGVLSQLDAFHSEFDFRIHEIDAGQTVGEVVLDVVDAIGLPRDPMIDVLREHEFIGPEEFRLLQMHRHPARFADELMVASQ